ncbi:DUF4174 domain-containing protein [Microbulbifer yueqingensis]|uniref:DUF4174 domain-containing protein n=1 Tax=Microbulbifer yueqingensis TaxID=658219 RepID=A0A1G9AE95_9GAMM|nr:DUF4174 domain-containing protein [Microbulbifer yueqingensis]SDK25679.1 protein of unknown function [Microbulbifer yueqingensis]
MNRLRLQTGALLALSLAAATAASAPPLNDLAPLVGEKRVLLIRGTPATAGYPQQLREARVGVAERDLVWFRLTPPAIASNYAGSLAPGFGEALAQRYFGDKNTDATVILIGKDGTVKAGYRKLDLEGLFDRIDSMPMRQQEMRQERTRQRQADAD